MTLWLGEQGVRSTVGGIEARIPRRAIQHVVETREGLFLALICAALLQVPRRALPSADAFADLAGRARTKVTAAVAGQ